MANPLAQYMAEENPLEKYVVKESPLAKYSTKEVQAEPLAQKAFKGYVDLQKNIFKSAVTPVSETLGFKRPSQAVPSMEQTTFEGQPIKSFLATLGAGMAGDIADIATTPLSYIPLPAGRLAGQAIGKIPVKGTTLGQVAKRVPLGKGFSGRVKELARLEKTLKPFVSQLTSRMPGLTPLESESVAYVTNALKKAKPLRQSQEKLFSEVRKRQLPILKAISEERTGQAGAFKKLKVLSEELPKLEFKELKIPQKYIDTIYNMVHKTNTLNEWDKLPAINGLNKIFGEKVGLPTTNELDKLTEVFPRQFIKTLLDKRPLLTRMGENVAEIANIPRALMATFDMSAPLRQGVFLIGRPRQWIPSFKNMFRYFFKEKAYQGLMEDIKKRPNYSIYKKAGLNLTQLGSRLGKREEAFMSQLPEKIPLLGRGVRASNRAYTGFINKLRVDVFDDLYDKAIKLGNEPNKKLLTSLAEFVNASTGRGHMPSVIDKHAVLLNSIFFSPRLLASRLSLLNPQFYYKLHPTIRKEALKSLFTFSGIASTVLMAAKMGGAKVDTDLRSADAFKVKVGKTRYDVLGGFQQYMRLAAQLITGQRKSSTTGVVTTAGEGYKPMTRLDLLTNFAESKTAPALSYFRDVLRGQKAYGQEFEPLKEIGLRLTPLLVQDAYDLAQDRGVQSLGMALPAVFGVGMQTYNLEPENVVQAANSVERYSKEMFKQGRRDEAIEIMQDNTDLRRLASRLKVFDDLRRERERYRDEVRKNTRLSKEQKVQRLERIDKSLQKIENEMRRIMEQDKLQNLMRGR